MVWLTGYGVPAIYSRSGKKIYLPRKIVISRTQDKPWVDGNVRQAIRKINRLLKIHTKKMSPLLLGKVQNTKKLYNSINKA